MLARRVAPAQGTMPGGFPRIRRARRFASPVERRLTVVIIPAPATLILTQDQPALVRRMSGSRELHRVRPGVFVATATWNKLAPWDRYLLRVHAVLLTWTDPTLCLESAAVVRGLPIFGEPREVHLLSPDATTWHAGDVVVHGARDGRELDVLDGTSVTSVTDTAVDLARVLPPAFALGFADAALRRIGEETAPDFSARGRSQQNRRGLRQLDWVQARATPKAESVGESVSRAAIEWLGYEAPELQVVFRHEGAADRCDFFWREQRIIGESDGYGKYDASDADEVKAHFVREKKREDRLRRHEGGVVRWDWADTVRGKPLDEKLRAGGLSPVRGPHTALLATLSSNPRSLTPLRRTTAVSSKRTS